jgi:predicted glycoside hydrolase/deacetylase ChbG (UPF0249 family)
MLREKCKLAEIAVRLKIGNGQERFIAEQVEVLRKINGEAFHRDAHRHIHEHYAPVLEKAERIAKSRKFPIPIPFADATKEADNIQRRKNVLMERIGEDYTGEVLADDMLCFLTKPQETLILLGDTPDSQRVFVPADGQVEGGTNEQI